MNARGNFNRIQVRQLLRPIEPYRVVTGAHVKPHLSQQDVLAHLSRLFGFGNFDVAVLESVLLFEEPTTNKSGNPAWHVAYRALVRLTIRNEHGETVAMYDGGSTGESEGQPSRAASHDLAYKSALSTATKRAAIHLGDQFGLSLYNRGQMEALVRGSLVGTDWAGDDVQEGVPQQQEDGGQVADRSEGDGEEPTPEPSALPPATKRATKGRQGTRRKAAPKAAEPAPEPKPEPTPEPAPEATPEDEERAARAEMAAEQERQVTERERIIATADEIDRSDEAAVARWNEEHGKAIGHFITSDAERAAQAAKLADPEPEPEPATGGYLDDKTGAVYDTQEELDAAIAERVKANRAQREAAAAPSGPSAFELALAEEPDNYERQIAAAETIAELRGVWDRGQAANALTAELSMKVSSRKAEIEAAGA